MAIAKQVHDRLEQEAGPLDVPELFSPEVLEAMRMADFFEDIQPEQYKLPLDALIGMRIVK